MTTAALSLPRIQHPILAVAGLITAGLRLKLLTDDGVMVLLLLIGVGLGMALYHASFGFAGAYRKAIVDKDIPGVSAQLLMIGTAILLFAPILSQGEAFGHNVGGAFTPVSVSMALGAFVLSSSCSSPTAAPQAPCSLSAAKIPVWLWCSSSFASARLLAVYI